MPDNPKQRANSRNEELGLVSSYVNNRTDGCIWVLNQKKSHRRKSESLKQTFTSVALDTVLHLPLRIGLSQNYMLALFLSQFPPNANTSENYLDIFVRN